MSDISIKRTAQDKIFVIITYDVNQWSDVRKMYLYPGERIDFTVTKPTTIYTTLEQVECVRPLVHQYLLRGYN